MRIYSYLNLSTVTVELDSLLTSTVTMPNLLPTLLFDGGQTLYSSATVVSPNTFVIQFSSPFDLQLNTMYYTYSKPSANSLPQLRNSVGLPIETQRKTKVLVLSQYNGTEPNVGDVSTAVNSFGTEPSVDDFILTYGEYEAKMVSNIGEVPSDTVNKLRISNAIQDALVWIDTFYQAAPLASKTLIQATRRRSALIIARYYLDSCRRRTDVTQDYERVIKDWDIDTENNLPIVSGNSLVFSYIDTSNIGCCTSNHHDYNQ